MGWRLSGADVARWVERWMAEHRRFVEYSALEWREAALFDELRPLEEALEAGGALSPTQRERRDQIDRELDRIGRALALYGQGEGNDGDR